MQQMTSSSMEGQEEAQKQMDALTAQLQAAIQVMHVNQIVEIQHVIGKRCDSSNV